MNAGNITVNADIAALIPVLISIAALFVSVYTFRWTRSARRKKLISAVYWHVKFTQENLESLMGALNGLSDKMQADESFTPKPICMRWRRVSARKSAAIFHWTKRFA